MSGAAAITRSRPDPALDEALRQVAALGRLSDGDVRAIRAGRRRMLAGGTAAALIVATIGGAALKGLFAPTPVEIAHLETLRGERASVRLKDGSTLTLEGATSLDVRLAAESRTVRLWRGAAFFDVAHQPDRPFRVEAGAVQVAVLGTAFTIDRGSDGAVALAVYRGRVRFGAAGGGEDVPAGYRARAEAGVLTRPARFDPAAAQAGEGWIDTDAMRLRDLVDLLNRRAGPAIAPPPPALAGLALSGRFRLDSPQDLLEAIGATDGFTVRVEGGKLRLVPLRVPHG